MSMHVVLKHNAPKETHIKENPIFRHNAKEDGV